MGKHSFIIVALFFLGWLSLGPLLSAVADEPKQSQDESPGLADLDEATQAKLTAERPQHLARVIELCESALRKGLSEDHAVLAKQLLVGTRFERATVFSSMIFDRQPPDQRWAQYRELAVTDLEKALEHDADNVQVHMLLGRLYALPGEEGGRDRAIAALNKVIELSGENKQQKSKALAYRAAAQTESEKRDADLNESIELDPQNLDAIRTRAMVRVDAREYEKAVADLQAAVKLDPENPRMHEILAVTLLALGKTDEAIEGLGMAIKLAPDRPSAYAQRSRIYFIEGKYELALEDSAAAIELAPRNPAVQLLHAKNLQEDGQTREALRLVTQMLVVNPRLASAIEMRASLLADDGKFAEAIAEVKKAFERDPENLQLLGTLATLYAANKQAAMAIETYDRLLEAGIKIAPVYRSRADALLSLGRQADALADYQKALELDPEDAGILNNLAWLMATSPDAELRDAKKALELATEACRLSEYKKAYILSTLAAAHAESGDFTKAIEWAEKAVELSGEDVIEQLKAELESYRRNEPWREIQSTEASSSEADKTEDDKTEAGSQKDAVSEDAVPKDNASKDESAADPSSPEELPDEKSAPDENDESTSDNDIDPPTDD